MALQIRRGCQSCVRAGCLECKGGRAGIYGGQEPERPLSCDGCAPGSIVYFNLSLFNPLTATTSIPASIIDTRSTAIIDDPDNWEMSVVRFDVSSQLVPPMILPMANGVPPPPPAMQPAFVPTQLSVTLSFGGVDSTAPVQIPYGGPATFGYVFSFDELTSDINAAFAAAFAGLVAPPKGALPPFLYFDPISQMFRLIFQVANYGVNPLIEIWVNTNTYKYLDSMPAFFSGLGQPSGKDFRIQVERTSSVSLPSPPGPGFPVLAQAYTNSAYLTQAGPSLASTNGVRSVFISSNLLPINPEGLPTTSTPGQNVSYSSNSTPILSDFLLSTNPDSNPVVDRISISYLPTAEYRMIQLRGRSPIKQVDIKFFFTLFDGSVKELLIFPGGYCSAKILFRRSARSTLQQAA